MNIFEWAATAKSVETDENHPAEEWGFDQILEHVDGSWIGVVTEPQDTAKYFVVAGFEERFFDKLTDAQQMLWMEHARFNYND